MLDGEFDDIWIETVHQVTKQTKFCHGVMTEERYESFQTD